jgi:hypothetical protein
MIGTMNIDVATVTAYSATNSVILSKNVKYDGGFTPIFRRKPKKIVHAAARIMNQSRSAPTGS